MRKLLLFPIAVFFIFSFLTVNAQQANPGSGDNPSARQKYSASIEKDPALGYVPYHRLLNAINHTEALKAAIRNGNTSNLTAAPLPWIERGPIFDSVGPSNGNGRGGGTGSTAGGHTSGRMRAFLLDTLNDPTGNTAFTGGVAGGLWKCTNFLSVENNWTPVDDRFDNLAISSIAQDPSNPQIIYFSTGEPTDNADRVTGLGVWKSVNGGVSFTHLPSTTNYMRCFKIGFDAAGNVYLACRITTVPVNQQGGLFRSTNGGTTWTDITPNNLDPLSSNSCTDFEFTASGNLNATFGYRAAGNVVNHRYTTAPATVTPGTWLSGAGFRPSNAAAIRTEMAVMGNILYAITINPAYNTDSCYKSIDGGVTWTKQNTVVLPTGLGSGQGWYNISLAINPSNTSELISGGLDGYRSINDGATWTRFTFWVTTLPYVHADHHYAQFWISGGQTRIIMGTDGGVFYSNNNGATFTSKNKNLGIKQFYSAAIHPTAGSPYLLAGAQDNGTHQLSNPGLSYSIEVTGGDGCIVHINQQNPLIQFGSYVYNQYRRSVNGGATWQSVNFSGSQGQFVNPFDYDDAQNIMYCGNTAGTVRRWDNANTTNTSSIITVTNMTGSLLSVKYSPHTANRIFFGTNNGRLFRLDNANTATSTAAVDITGASFSTGTIICVNTGTDDNNLVATYSNFGVNNVWVSTNGGTSWSAVDGDLPDMPVRWAMFEPGSNAKLYLATEAGIYTTTNINGSSTQWLPETTFPTVSTYMLKMRASDSTIVAGTHGRGLWTAKIPPGGTPPPTVTINQAAAQPDPTSVSPINFTVVFDQAVTGFATGDVTLSGTAGATTGTVTGSGTTYNVAVSGMTLSGTVIATIPAGVCINGAGDPNQASTSTDNTVTYNLPAVPPTVTINQAAAQPDPTSVSPINFTVVFSQVVTGFTTGDVTLSGTAGATTGTVTGSGTTYNVAVSGMTLSGTVIATIAAGVCINGAGDPNQASTSTDNTVTFTLCVTNPVVTNNANAGAGSLRQAVIDACPGSTITFNMSTVTSPITLTTGEISILKNLTIQGPGAAILTINGGGSGRIFYVANAGVTGNINDLTLTGGTGAGAVNTGRGGAAYNNLANMNLTNLVITANTAANGGGVNTAGGGSITTITNSTISNNTSTSSGGGLQNFSTSTTHVIGSTISGNISTGSFGGAFQANGTTTFTNSTISGNNASSSGGGLYFNGTSATIINSTITNNSTAGLGGGINKTGTNPLNIQNTIIAGNTVGTTAPDVAGTVISQGFNLVGKTDGSTGFTQPTDLTGTIAVPLNPMIGTLANNGGLTQTHALLTGSPAIDKGSAANNPVTTLPIITDQRGSIRPVDFPAIPDAAGGNASDIGAFELGSGAVPPNVTINQAAAQPDPTSVSPINFTVVFSQVVTGFATGDVTLSGTAGATTGTVTGSGTTYNVAVSGMVAGGTVIATIPAGVCINGTGDPNTASTSTDNTVTYNPAGCTSVDPVPNQTVCNNSATAPVNFTSPTPGTTFAWTNNNTTIGLAASGTGNIASFTATNAGAAPVVATITVTPSLGACTGPSTTFTITVNPTPSVNAIPNQVVCTGSPTAPVNFTGTPAGVVYTWTNNTPAIGLAASGTGNIASFIATNPGITPLVATITVTPVTGLAAPVTTTFNYTGAVQTFVVPAGITSLNLKAWGAQGNRNALATTVGGLGGYAEGNLAVTPGQTIFINTGGGAATSITGGFNGGGNAGANAGCATAQGGGGGGASDVRITANTLANRVLVAGGGGGAGGNRVAGCGRGAGGGGGGGLYGGGGGAGWPGVPGGQGPVPTGGTQAAGGAGGVTTFTPGPTNGFPGVLGIGGAGGTEIGSAQGGSATSEPGGIGGGLIGGSGLYNQANNWCGQSGAGGSSYIGGVTAGITTSGLRTGAGMVTVTYTPTSAATCFGAPRTFTITVNPNPSLVIVADPGSTICLGDPTLLTVRVGTSSPVGVLYNQAGVAGNGSPSQVFEPANAAFTSQSADDFVVPAGTTWTITRVTADGIGAGVPTSINVFFYNNSAANLPGTAVASFNNILTFTQAGGNYNVTLPSNLVLSAGTYWVSVQVNMSFATSGQWFWGNFGTTNILNQYAWQNPGGGFGTPCTSWGYGATGCAVGGGVNRNNIFSIVGSSLADGGPLPPGYTFLWSPAAGLSSTTTNPVAAAPMVTTTYTVNVNTAQGCTNQASILITVNQRPTVTTHPVSRTNCAGTTATFTAAGTGTGLTYQWQVSTTGCAGPWTNLTNTAPYSGVNTATLTINPVTALMNGYGYRVVLSGACAPINNANISNCAVLTANPLPVVTISPASPVCGGVAGISGTALTASGASGSYVWSPITGLYNNPNGTGAYTGTNQATVYAAPVVNTVYTVTGTNTGTGCFNTATITVIYTPAPPIVSPANVSMCLGDNAVQLCITSSLAPSPFTTTYNSGPIAVSVPDNTPAGGNHTITSTLPSTAQITNVRVNINMSHTWVGDCAVVLRAPNGRILNLDYFLSATGGTGATTGFTNTTISSSSTTLLSSGTNPYTGTFRADAVTAGTPAPGPTGFAPNTALWSDLYTTPNGGWTLAAYDAFAGDFGLITSWSIAFDYLYGIPASGVWSPAAGLFRDAAATIPYVAGDTANCVWARPTPSGVYPYQATVQSLSISGATIPLPPHVSTFTGNVRGYWFTAPSSFTMTSVEVPTSASTGTQNIAVLRFNGAVPPPAFPGTTNAFTTLFLTQNNPSAGPITVNIPINAGDVIGMLGVRSNINSYSGNPPNTTIINGTPVNLTRMGMQFPLATTAPQQIWQEAAFQISRVFFSYGIPLPGCTSPPRTVVVTVNQPTTITTQPVNQTICTDKVATFTVAAAGTGPFSYQWQVSTNGGNTYTNIANGGVYSGATTATLTITAPPVSMSGYYYRAVITGAAPCAAANSFHAILTVNPLPVIVISVSPYTSLFPGLVTVLSSTVSPNAAATYTWLRNGVVVAGANAATLNVDIDGLGTYQLRVNDVNGCTNVSNILTIKDSITSNCFIYPNPNSGIFQVRYYSVANNVLPRSLTVYDAKGDRVLTQFYTIGRPYDRMDVDMRKYGKGLYWVEIGDMNGNRLTMCRIVIQ